MITLIVGNSYTKIVNAQPTILNAIDKLLTATVAGSWFSPAYKSGKWDGTVKLFNRKENKFYTGLLYMVIEYLNAVDDDEDFQYNIMDKRTCKEFMLDCESFEEITLQASGKQLRDYQVQSVNDVMYSTLVDMKWQRGILNLATNSGKTTIAEAIIQYIHPLLQEQYLFPGDDCKKNPVFMFLTHSKEIAYQAKQSLENDLGISVGIVGDGKWNVQSVTVGITTTLASRLKNKKPEFKELSNRVVGFVADECHHVGSDTYSSVLESLNNAVIRVGLSGTIEKDDSRRLKLFGLTGQIITKVNNNFLIKRGFSAKPRYNMVPIDYPDDIDDVILPNNKGEQDYSRVYDMGIVNNMWRNYVIAKICEKEVHENAGQVLILVDRLEHGANICECFDYLQSDVKRMFLYGDLTSEERQDGLNKLVNKELDVLIATTILDEGVDVPNINALIYARGGKSIRKLLQGVGRGLRKKADGSELRIYDFVDDTAFVLIKQSKSRLDTMSKEKFSCKKFDTESDLGITSSEFQAVMNELDRSDDYRRW